MHEKENNSGTLVGLFVTQFLPRCMECRRGLAMRILSVRLSVSPSVCHTRELWQTVERSVQIYIPYERSFSLVFWEERLVGSDPFYVKFWVNRPPLERNRRFSTNNRSCSSAVTPSEKSSINTNRKSTHYALSNEPNRRMLPLSPQRGSQKSKTADFRVKSHFAWRKCATKFLCVKAVSGKVVRHSLA